MSVCVNKNEQIAAKCGERREAELSHSAFLKQLCLALVPHLLVILLQVHQLVLPPRDVLKQVGRLHLQEARGLYRLRACRLGVDVRRASSGAHLRPIARFEHARVAQRVAGTPEEVQEKAHTVGESARVVQVETDDNERCHSTREEERVPNQVHAHGLDGLDVGKVPVDPDRAVEEEHDGGDVKEKEGPDQERSHVRDISGYVVSVAHPEYDWRDDVEGGEDRDQRNHGPGSGNDRVHEVGQVLVL